MCSTQPDVTDSVLQQPQQDSWTSMDHQYVNGEEETIAWGDTEVQMNRAHGTDQLGLFLEAGRESPEEAEQWEQIVWPAHPVTCAGAPLSFATVQWDMPDPSAATPSFRADGGVANEPSSGGSESLGTASPSLHQSQRVNADLFIRQGRVDRDEVDSRFLNFHRERTGNGSEPCDAADVQEPPTQEREDSTHELLGSNNGIPLRADSKEQEEGCSGTSYPVETVVLINILEGNDISEVEVDSCVDSKLEEEQVEPGVLLTGQGDSSANGVEDEEESEEDEEKQINESCTEESEDAKDVRCLSNVEFPAEQTDGTGPTVSPDELIDRKHSELLEERQHSGPEEAIALLQRFHEDPNGQTAEPDMSEDVDHEQSDAADDHEEPWIKAADNTERIENSPEIIELTEEPKETSRLEERHCGRVDLPLQPQRAESERLEMTGESKQIQAEVSRDSDRRGKSQRPKQPPEMELPEESTRREAAALPEDSTQSELTASAGVAERREQTEPSEQNEQMPQTSDSSQPALSGQLAQPETDESEATEHLSPEPEVTRQTARAEFNQVDKRAETSHRGEEAGDAEDGSVRTTVANEERPESPETAAPQMNGDAVTREMARRLAERLYGLDGIQRADVVKHLDKDNDFSRAVGEEYLKLFDFTGETLDFAVRSFLKVVVLIGETQERERVLQHFACRFHQCNPDSFTSSESVLALTCSLMLLNTDLHGQNVGKSMSSTKFVSNLDGMNEGENFSKDLLKSLYNSIKSEPLQWAIDEEELKSSVLVDEDAGGDAPLRSKANPFQDIPHDKTASVAKQGFLQRKLHADIDGKRTPWGKRGWKTFYGVVRGMVLYLQKDDYRRDQPLDEEVVSLHHSLAEQAAEYTKKPHVLRLQTADWRVLLFQASSKMEMHSWISRINLVSALHSSPPFPAAVGSQRRFCRPILPSAQSAQTLERQLQSYAGTLQSFKDDLLYLQQNMPEGKRAKAKELEEHRVRAEYLQHEMCRYELYIQGLEAWRSVKTTGGSALSVADLKQFDKAVCGDSVGEGDEVAGGLKKSHSSPSLELEMVVPTVIKVKRNISERRTYRRTVIPRWNKEV